MIKKNSNTPRCRTRSKWETSKKIKKSKWYKFLLLKCMAFYKCAHSLEIRANTKRSLGLGNLKSTYQTTWLDEKKM